MPVNYATPAADQLFPVAGVRLGIAEAEIRKKNRRDLTLVALDPGCTVAGVFTQNRFCAAPVQLCRDHLASGKGIRALVINTGIANAGTGEPGMLAAQETCAAVGALLGIAAEQVLPFSTGVILEPLPVDRLKAGLPAAQADLQGGQLACRRARHHDHRHRRQGRFAECRGQRQNSDHFRHLQGRRHDQAEHGDHARFRRHRRRHRPAAARQAGQGSRRCLLQLHHRRWRYLDQRLVRDDRQRPVGCAVRIRVRCRLGRGQGSDHRRRASNWRRPSSATAKARPSSSPSPSKAARTARNAARSATRSATRRWSRPPSSPPTPTSAAFWRPSAMPASPISMSTASRSGSTTCWSPKRAAAPRAYREEDGARIMKQAEITVRVDLGRGNAAARVYTCDFSYDYVKINADYRS